jgi:hypothetical protein
VDIYQSWLRQEIQAGNIKITWIPMAEMVVDGFTKLLSAQKHEEFLAQLGMVNIKARQVPKE